MQSFCLQPSSIRAPNYRIVFDNDSQWLYVQHSSISIACMKLSLWKIAFSRLEIRRWFSDIYGTVGPRPSGCWAFCFFFFSRSVTRYHQLSSCIIKPLRCCSSACCDCYDADVDLKKEITPHVSTEWIVQEYVDRPLLIDGRYSVGLLLCKLRFTVILPLLGHSSLS